MEVETSYFIDDDVFQEETAKEEILERAKKMYGNHGMAQARRIYESAKGLYAGGQLNEEEQDEFRDLMMELFFETKEDAKIYTPKKYKKNEPDS